MDMFYALAEPNRRSILEMLASQGELPVSAIAEKFHISTSAISQHLKVLRDAKLVLMEKRAQQRIYKVNLKTVHELENWAKHMAAKYEALDELLKDQHISKEEE